MFRVFLKVAFSELVKWLTLPIRLMPIKKNRILFTGLTGGNGNDYSCNPKYLYEFLRDNYPGKYEYVWVVKDKKRFRFLEEEGVKVVEHFTVSSFPMLLTSKVIVTNGSYAPWFAFRKKQYVINTWHGGGAYKKVENEKPDANWATRRRAKFCADNIDLFLASCKVQEQQMIRTTYQYNGAVLQAGTPRNDKLVCGDIEESRNKVRQFYQLGKEVRIVLYAPTYRNAEPPVVMETDKVLNALTEMGEKWVFLSRFHRYQNADMNIKVTGEQVIDVADYPDMQELLCAADILITDYSSCVWDYSFLRRPCLLFVPDKSAYIDNTGFYVGIEEWPFLMAENMEELLEIIKSLKAVHVREKLMIDIQQHLNVLGSYEEGCCRQKLADIIEEQTQ